MNQNKQKVLYIHQHFNSLEGKGSVRSYKNALELIDSGYEVTILTGLFEKGVYKSKGVFTREIIDGIKVIRINITYSNEDFYLKRAFNFLLFSILSIYFVMRENYDLLYATSTPITVAIPAIIAKKVRRKKYIFEVRDLWPDLPIAMGIIKNSIMIRLLKFLEISAYKNSVTCIGLSPGIIDGIKKHVPSKECIMIPNGCDPHSSFEIKHTNLLNSKKFNLIYAGTHGVANGLSTLIEACKLIQDNNFGDIHINLIGSGMLKKDLIDQSHKLGLKNISFFDPVSKNEIFHILSSADVGLQVLANYKEFYYGTSPNKFFDYISCGLPVIVNYPGWVNDLLQEYNGGLYAKPDSPDSLASAIIHIYSDEFLCKDLSKGSLELSRKFQRNFLAKKVVEVVDKALKKHSR